MPGLGRETKPGSDFPDSSMAKSQEEVDAFAGSLAKAVVKASKVPSRSALLEFMDAVYEAAGGPRAFAKLLMEAYKDPSTPPSIRTRVLDVVTKIAMVTHEKVPQRFNAGDVSDEDLKHEIEMYLSDKNA